MPFLNEYLPILIYILLCVLIILLIVICIKVIKTMNKVEAIVLDVALPMLMLLSHFSIDLNMYGGFTDALRIACYVLFGLGTVLTVYSGVNYLVKNAYVFKESDKQNIEEENK